MYSVVATEGVKLMVRFGSAAVFQQFLRSPSESAVVITSGRKTLSENVWNSRSRVDARVGESGPGPG